MTLVLTPNQKLTLSISLSDVKGSMTTAPGFVDERIIFYKHADANFFSAYPFVVGKAISKLPQVRFFTDIPCRDRWSL